MAEDKEETLEELKAKITHPGKLAFLEQYPKFKRVMITAQTIGVSDSTIRVWRREDETFNTAFHALKKEITQELIAIHEQNIDDVCLATDTPAQSRIFGSLVKLRAYDPDRYREKSVTETKLTGNITVKMAIPRPNDPQITEVKPEQIEDGTKQDKE